MFKRLLSSVREYRKPTVITMLFILLEAVIETFIPFLAADLIDRIQREATGEMLPTVMKIGVTLILMACLSLACGGIAGYTSAQAAAGFAKNLRRDMFAKIQSYSFENIDRFSSASLVTRITKDVNDSQMAYMMVIRIALRAPLMLLFSVIMAFYMGGMLAIPFLVVIPVLGGGLYLVGRKAMPTFRRIFKKYDRMNESVEENVRGMRVVKGFSREEYEKKKFSAASDDIRREFTYAERIVALNTPLMQVCIYFNMAVILLIGTRMAVGSGGALVNVGEISAMLTYGFQILMQLMMLAMIYVILTMSEEAFRRIGEVLSEEPVLKNPENPVCTVADGSVDFENVSFKYSAQAKNNTLEGVHLHIPSGAVVGILGGTGSSKSTLVQLIPRLYDVTEGSVKVGGVDVRDYDLDTLRGNVAMVLQKNLLFSGTVKENLRWGNENATDEELVEACKLAQADDFIRSLPEGYDTHIEQGGTNVSGGQKQRLCIARALLKKPKILILDDSTSAVDTKTDALIRAGFKRYIPETTKIIIAQRVSSVADADLILVMDGGKVVATGRHDELLADCKIYREVYESQTMGGDENA